MSKTYSKTRILVECALMIAIGTVLSNIKIFTMPNGGSVTLLSMLPFVLVSFRHGVKWGLFTGLVNGCLQMLLGFWAPPTPTFIYFLGEVLLDYLRTAYPRFYFVSSTTKVLTGFPQLRKELEREAFRFVVPDFRLNRAFDRLAALPQSQKDKVEFLCNECCWFGCYDRKNCYEIVSRQNLGEDCPDHVCVAPDSQSGYRFSKAMENPAFISVDDIRNTYMPMGFSNFKIEGRGLGSALVLEFLLYYMIKPEYQIHVREDIYLDNMLDIF